MVYELVGETIRIPRCRSAEWSWEAHRLLICSGNNFSYRAFNFIYILLKFLLLIEKFNIQPYTINGAKVIFINQRPQSRAKVSSNVCFTCNRILQEPFHFCSLSCKVVSVTYSFWNLVYFECLNPKKIKSHIYWFLIIIIISSLMKKKHGNLVMSCWHSWPMNGKVRPNNSWDSLVYCFYPNRINNII